MTRTDPYAAHAAFIAPAQDGHPAWSVAAGLFVTEIAFYLSPLLLFPFYGESLYLVLEGKTAWTLFLALMIYGVPAFAIVQWVRHYHQRSGWSLIGPPVTAWRHLTLVAWAVLLALLAIELSPPFPNLSLIVESRALPIWMLSLPLATLAVVIQSGSEELIFRGYLQQQLAARWRHPVVWMVLPSMLFGFLHYWNALGAAQGILWAIWACLLGVACADLTARTGTIGAAIGLHSTNNLFIFCTFGMQDGPDSGFALFLYPFRAPVPGPDASALLNIWALFEIASSAAFVAILWLAARIALKR